jgi:flagellar protein FliJ
MKRFKWRLQRVLDIKRKEEQVKRAELFELTDQLSLARGELFMQKGILENLIIRVSEKPPHERLYQQELLMIYSAANDMRIKSLEEKVQELAMRQKEKIVEILAVKKFYKGLEKLRDEAKAAFIKGQEKLEQKESDEQVTAGFVRRAIGCRRLEELAG